MTNKKVRSLIAKLQTGKQRTRQEAAIALGVIQDPQSVPALIQALKPEPGNWQTRREATRALVSIGPAALPALIETYADEDQDSLMRHDIGRVLVQIGSPAVPALVKFLKDSDPGVYVWHGTGSILCEIGDPQAVPFFVECLGYTVLRQEATEALERIGFPAVPALTAGLEDRDIACEVIYDIVKVLARIGPPAVPVLIEVLNNHENLFVCQEAAHSLGKIAQDHSHLALRAVLPTLHRLRKRSPIFQEALNQIETATFLLKDLPLPAATPVPDARTLPRLTAAEDVPVAASMTPPPHWWVRLRRALTRS